MSRYYILPKGDELPYHQLKITWFSGLDPVEIASGDFILNEEAVKLLDSYPSKTVTVDEKEVNAKTELQKYPVKEAKDIIFKIYEEPVIIEGSKTIKK